MNLSAMYWILLDLFVGSPDFGVISGIVSRSVAGKFENWWNWVQLWRIYAVYIRYGSGLFKSGILTYRNIGLEAIL